MSRRIHHIAVARSFIKIAKADIAASEVLYKTGFFSQAVYLLQQGVEKSTKSFGLAFELINVDNLRDVSHISSRVFFGWDKKREKFKDLFLIPLENGIIASFDTKMLRTFSDCDNNPRNHINLSLDELNNFIEKYTEDEHSVEICKKLFENNEEWCDCIYQERDKILPSSMIYKNIDKKVLVDYGFSLLDLMLVSESLLILSIILQPHEAIARYPHIDNDEFNPIDFYADGLPIVDKFPQIIKIAASNIDKFASSFILKLI